jgi:CheY-like chemotaxis protein
VWQALAKLADTPAEAVDALRELVRVAPDQPHGHFALRNALAADARALAESGRTGDARARWQEIISTTNGDVEAWLGVAATTSDENEAAQAIETAHRLNPTHEQVIEAKARLERSRIDPATVEAPIDAFARFDTPADVAAPADDPFAQLDSTLDAFAQLSEPAEAPAPGPTPTPTPTFAIEAPAAVAPEPIVDLESALEEAAVVETVSIDQPDQTVSLDFDTVMEFEAPASGHQSPDLSLQSPVVSPQSPVVSSQSPVASPQSEDVAAAVPAAVESASAPAYSSSRKTVMIVDDSPTIRKILGLTLERAGYKVIAEPDGESAIERLLQVVPDLILLDIAMPKIDGYEVCKRIKQDPRTKTVPVVMLSGKGALFDKVKGHMAGASEYLTKPFETPAVLAVVATYCEKTAEVVNG